MMKLVEKTIKAWLSWRYYQWRFPKPPLGFRPVRLGFAKPTWYQKTRYAILRWLYRIDKRLSDWIKRRQE